MTCSGAPPTVDTKYEFVHNVGSRDFSVGNSFRKVCDEIPLRYLTSRCIPELWVYLDQQVYVVWHNL